MEKGKGEMVWAMVTVGLGMAYFMYCRVPMGAACLWNQQENQKESEFVLFLVKFLVL